MKNHGLDLFEQFARLERLLRRYHQQNCICKGSIFDPYRGQGKILSILKLKPEISQRELSSILDMRSQSLGELLGKLERSGYITRKPSKMDRRAIDIYLTERGKQILSENVWQLDGKLLFECLNEEEQVALRDYLNRIIFMLERQFNNKLKADI